MDNFIAVVLIDKLAHFPQSDKSDKHALTSKSSFKFLQWQRCTLLRCAIYYLPSLYGLLFSMITTKDRNSAAFERIHHLKSLERENN